MQLKARGEAFIAEVTKKNNTTSKNVKMQIVKVLYSYLKETHFIYIYDEFS